MNFFQVILSLSLSYWFPNIFTIAFRLRIKREREREREWEWMNCHQEKREGAKEKIEMTKRRGWRKDSLKVYKGQQDYTFSSSQLLFPLSHSSLNQFFLDSPPIHVIPFLSWFSSPPRCVVPCHSCLIRQRKKEWERTKSQPKDCLLSPTSRMHDITAKSIILENQVSSLSLSLFPTSFSRSLHQHNSYILIRPSLTSFSSIVPFPSLSLTLNLSLSLTLNL